jgi:polyribonucleotide 5'-hydroxyl-kinase
MAVAPVTMEATSVTDSVDSANTTPLVYWYGHTGGMANTDLLRILIAQLAKSVNERLLNETDAVAASSGIIVNSMGCFMEGEGYNILLHVVEQMDINVVLVMGHDRLYSMLRSHFNKQLPPSQSNATSIKVIKLPRSGGVVSRDSDFRQRLRSNSIRRYFHGEVTPFQPNVVATRTPNVASSDKEQSQTLVYRFTPNLIDLHFDDVEIYKTSQDSLSRGMLPIIGEQRTSKVQLIKVEQSSYAKHMIHSVVAVCQPSAVEAYEKMISQINTDDSLYNDDEDDLTAKAQELLYSSSVAGFLVIEKVDLERQRFSFLSPCSGDLPSRTLLIGDITWME